MSTPFKIPPGKKIDLRKFNPKDTGDYSNKDAAKKDAAKLRKKLEELQEKLYAGKNHAVLFIFQGMDCSGKDGVIRNALSSLHPQGFQTYGFKTPTPEESRHDFLWRAHKLVPGRGQMVAFNRSYYEDVLITRVHKMVSDEEAARKFKQINHFEELLTDNGVTIVKIFLNISKEFQLEKLIDRIENEEKNWKFDPNDLVERNSWDKYLDYYEDAFKNCSRGDKAWHIVPADHRWYRDLAVLQIAVQTLEKLHLQGPAAVPALRELLPELQRERSGEAQDVQPGPS